MQQRDRADYKTDGAGRKKHDFDFVECELSFAGFGINDLFAEKIRHGEKAYDENDEYGDHHIL